MVQVNVLIKAIETDPTGQMITLTVEANIQGKTQEVIFSEMVGNLRGMTDIQIKEHLKGILQDVIRQKIGEREELNAQKKWKRAQSFIGKTYTIEVE